MADGTAIQWTDATWNPIRGCSRVSEGCRNCYAEAVATRFSGPGQPYEGLVTVKAGDRHGENGRARTGVRGKWNGKIRFVEEHLKDPIRWRKPRRIFVNSMSDLFHENVTDEQIDNIFAVMALAERHTFQVLTKRPERMRDYIKSRFHPSFHIRQNAILTNSASKHSTPEHEWPLTNVWLGVSCEDQQTADTRVPKLLSTPAAVRFISAEPLLGPIWFHDFDHQPRIDWVIIGGESGPWARTTNLTWVDDITRQCQRAGVAVFVKQLGKRLVDYQEKPIDLKDSKGGDMSEWPQDLQVREFPDALVKRKGMR